MLFAPPPTQPFINAPLTALVQKQDPPKETPKPDYLPKEGENLITIAEAQGSSVERLWQANTQLTSPDLITVGEPLKIPLNSDTLADRPFPVSIVSAAPRSGDVPAGVFSSNPYVAGQCTAYAWSRRPDLPNNLGDAWTWAIRAREQGFPVSNTPKSGSIGVARSYGHVVYVDSVNANGTVNITEQNYKGPFIISTRVAPVSEFEYIL